MFLLSPLGCAGGCVLNQLSPATQLGADGGKRKESAFGFGAQFLDVEMAM